MPRKSKKTTAELPEEATMKQMEAQYELDREFLRFLEEHAIINKCGYDYKSDADKELFHIKYQDALNTVRAKFGLTPIELSKSTLERVKDEQPKKKRGRKAVAETSESPAPYLGEFQPPINGVFVLDGTESPRSINEVVPDKQIQRIMNELAKANKVLTKINDMITAVASKNIISN